MARKYTDKQHADALAFAQQVVSNPGTTATAPSFMRSTKKPAPSKTKRDRYQSPPIIATPSVPAPVKLPPITEPIKQAPIMNDNFKGIGGIRTADFQDSNNNGIDDRDESSTTDFGGQDFFGDPGSGTYDNLMSQAFSEYSSGQSPYSGFQDYLMGQSVFDRGARPDSSMPSFSYSNAGGFDSGLSQMQAQQPGIQAQYDEFAQQIQSAQEAAQQQAQQQSELAASERQQLMDRISALEAQEGPDLDAFRQEILSQIPEQQQIDVDALRRELTGEVLAIAQSELPDVLQIRDEVLRLLPEQEQIDIENLRRQIQEAIDAGAPEEEIAALRQELQNRIRPVEEQIQALQSESPDIQRAIGELQGQIGGLPDIDVNAIQDRIREQILANLPEQERLDIEALQRQIQEAMDAGAPEEEIAELRQELDARLQPVESQVSSITDRFTQLRQDYDPGVLREQLARLQGQFDERGPVDVEAIRQQIQQGLQLEPTEVALTPEVRQAIAEAASRGDGTVPQALLDRLAAVERGPDLSGITQQIGELQGRLAGQPDRLAALREQIAGERAAEIAAQQERVSGQLTPLQERIATLREQQAAGAEGRRAIEQRFAPIQERIGEIRQAQSEGAEGRSALADRIAQVRKALEAGGEERRALGERFAPIQSNIEAIKQAQTKGAEGRRSLADRIAAIKAPTVDESAIAQRVREAIKVPTIDEAGIIRRLQESIKAPTIDEAAIAERVRRSIDVPTVDLSDIREQIAALQQQRSTTPTDRVTPIKRRGG